MGIQILLGWAKNKKATGVSRGLVEEIFCARDQLLCISFLVIDSPQTQHGTPQGRRSKAWRRRDRKE
jgi:hypothetical protein